MNWVVIFQVRGPRLILIMADVSLNEACTHSLVPQIGLKATCPLLSYLSIKPAFVAAR